MIRCRFPGCHGRGKLAKMPLIARWTWVCDRHRSWALIAVMRELVAHG